MEKAKECSRCRETKPLEEFTKDMYIKDGFCAQCKLCRAAIRQERRERLKSFKKCSVCGEIKAHTHFGKDATRKDGRKYACRACCKMVADDNKPANKKIKKPMPRKKRKPRVGPDWICITSTPERGASPWLK